MTTIHGVNTPLSIMAAIIADDLTGAADTGVQFCEKFTPTYLVDHKVLSDTHFSPTPKVLAINTNSRALPGEMARQVASAVGKTIRNLAPQWIYKKIDSCMRGNVGHEADALLDALELKTSFIAPAFPDQGRTTIHGIHLVHGIPVAKSEMGRDPVTPVVESRLDSLVAAQSRYRTACIDIDLLSQQADIIAGEINRLIASGIRHLVFDAAEQNHLDAIVNLAVTKFPDTLLVGSAGLARSLAENLKPANESETPLALSGDGNLLLVCGSASDRMNTQAEMLFSECSCRQIRLDPAVLIDPKSRNRRKALATTGADILKGECLLVQIDPPRKDGVSYDSGDVVKGLAELTCHLFSSTKPGALFLSGGDTAKSVIESLKTDYIRLDGQIFNGMVSSTLMGGDMHNVRIITKAGAFGPPETLVDLYRHWYQ